MLVFKLTQHPRFTWWKRFSFCAQIYIYPLAYLLLKRALYIYNYLPPWRLLYFAYESVLVVVYMTQFLFVCVLTHCNQLLRPSRWGHFSMPTWKSNTGIIRNHLVRINYIKTLWKAILRYATQLFRNYNVSCSNESRFFFFCYIFSNHDYCII